MGICDGCPKLRGNFVWAPKIKIMVLGALFLETANICTYTQVYMVYLFLVGYKGIYSPQNACVAYPSFPTKNQQAEVFG